MKLIIGLSILGLVLIAGLSVGFLSLRQLLVAQSQPRVAQSQPRPPVPIIKAEPPTDPNNRMLAFIACVKGNPTGCTQAGAWLIEQGNRDRMMQVCLIPRDDIEPDLPSRPCLDLTAEWPK